MFPSTYLYKVESRRGSRLSDSDSRFKTWGLQLGKPRVDFTNTKTKGGSDSLIFWEQRARLRSDVSQDASCEGKGGGLLKTMSADATFKPRLDLFSTAPFKGKTEALMEAFWKLYSPASCER